MNIYLSKAIDFVRARMDELSFSNDDMISPADDDRNFDTTVETLLPEAAEFVFRAAPAEYLEPQALIHAEDLSVNPSVEGAVSAAVSEDGVITVRVRFDSGFLRLVAFNATDSEIFITAPAPFNGPTARMQANKFVRGTWDDPVLIERKYPDEVEYSYYTASSKKVGFSLYKIDVPTYLSSDEKYIFCPARLELPVLNRLVGMVLDAYKEAQHAQTFYQKSATYFA